MDATITNRKSRRAELRTKPVALAGAALAATALTAAVTPPAGPALTRLDVALAADPVPQPAFGIGPIGGLITPLINALGMNPFPLPAGLGGIAYDFSGGAPTTQGIYNLINELPYKVVKDIDPNSATCKNASQDECRAAFVISTGYGALGTTDAIHALINAAKGTPVAGLDPLKPATGTGITATSAIYLNNILRPNGGFDTRFPMLVEPFGIDTTMPGVGAFGPNKDKLSAYNWTTDITWPYNTLADFPVTFSPLAIANSIFAAVPPPALINLVTSGADQAAILKFFSEDTAGTLFGTGLPDGKAFSFPTAKQCPANCGWASIGVIPLLTPLTGDVPPTGGGGIDGQALMLDATNPFIPLTTPLYINSLVANAVLKQLKSPYLLGTPLADILTPSLRILVNTAYDDVVTPDKLNTVNPNPAAEGKTFAQQGYKAYDRTFAQQPFTPVPFSWTSNPALTPEESSAAMKDAGTAFTDAVKAQSEKPLFGILVPNPDNPPAPKSAQAAPAAAVEAPADISIPAEDPAPVEVSAPATGGGSAKAMAADAGDNDNGGGHTRAARSGRG